MEKQELIEKLNSIKDVEKDVKILYSLMDDLGLKYEKTRCHRCRMDYLAMCKEELGLIADASQLSLFNDEENEVHDEDLEEKVLKRWYYRATRPTSWNGHIVSDASDYSVLEKFCESHTSYCEQV